MARFTKSITRHCIVSQKHSHLANVSAFKSKVLNDMVSPTPFFEDEMVPSLDDDCYLFDYPDSTWNLSSKQHHSKEKPSIFSLDSCSLHHQSSGTNLDSSVARILPMGEDRYRTCEPLLKGHTSSSIEISSSYCHYNFSMTH